MKYLIALLVLVQVGLFARSSQAQVTSWENSPLNYQNSPLNYQNSPLNYNSTNGVYDNNGNRKGYEVQTPSGVTNYFDNNGNRTGYSPSQRSR